MSERERFEKWWDGYLTSGQMSFSGRNVATSAWQARANLAAEREAELVKLLEIAQCPQCDGSGAVQVREDDVHQCQWCYERDVIIAKLKPEGAEET